MFHCNSWEFLSEGGDIGFRVYYKSREEGNLDLISNQRVESHLLMEEGHLTLEHAGKCNYITSKNLYIQNILHFYFSDVVEFDNSFSYLKPKKIHYFISVEPPTKKN